MSERKNIKSILFYVFLGMLALSLLIAFVFVAIDVRGNRFGYFDEQCMNFALSIRAKWLTVIFTIITNLINPIVIGIVGFCILIFAKNKRVLSFQLFLNELQFVLYSVIEYGFIYSSYRKYVIYIY